MEAVNFKWSVTAEIESYEIAKFSIFSHHHGLERVNIRPANFVVRFTLNLIEKSLPCDPKSGGQTFHIWLPILVTPNPHTWVKALKFLRDPFR